MRDVLKNISHLGAANIAVKPAWFLFVTAFCMKVLGVEGYGVFSTAIALSLITASLTDPGIVRYSSREISKDRSQASRFVSNLYPMRLATLLGASVIALVVGVVLDYDREALLAVVFASAYTASLQLTQYCRAILEAFERLKLESAFLVLEKVLVIGGGSIGLLLSRSPEWTLAGMAVGMALTMVAHAVWINRNLAPFIPALIDRGFLVGALRAMIPIGIGGMLISVYWSLDMVMIEAMLSKSAAGQYGVAYRIFEALNMVTAVVVLAVLYPRLSRLKAEKNYRDFLRAFRGGQIGLAVISLMAAVSLTVVAPIVISLLAGGSDYEASVGALRILVWAFPLLCANSLLYSTLLALGDERFTMLMILGAVFVNVALNAWLIPTLGINGSAVATIVPELLLLVAYAARFRRLWGQVLV